MTSIHLNDIALPKKFEKLPLSYYINVKSESEFSKNFSKIFFFNVISQTYPKMVLRNAVLQKFCHHKNGSKPFPSLIGSLGLNLLKNTCTKIEHHSFIHWRFSALAGSNVESRKICSRGLQVGST